MSILLSTFIPAERGWTSVGGQLLASGVLLLSGYQDIGWQSRTGAFFWFFMALAFAISALGWAIWEGLWSGTAICVVVFCFETWLVRHWWNRGARGS